MRERTIVDGVSVPRIRGGAGGIIQNSLLVLANTQVDDVLVNNILATSRQGLSVVDWAIVASATGLLVTLFNGVLMIAPEFAPNLQNRFPVWPDDFSGRFGLMPADRLLARVRNTTAGNLTMFYTFRFTGL
jgi:hypothetical protein